MRSVLPGLSAVMLLGACGPDAAVWLQVEAPLVVPSEADALHVVVVRASGASAFDKTYDLSKGPQFPLTLTLTNDDSANFDPSGLTVTCTALLAGSEAKPWSQASGNVVLEPGQIATLTLQMCNCP